MFKLDKIDPRGKIIMIAAISTGAMVVSNILMLTALLVFTVALLLIGGVEPGRQLKQGRAAFGMVIFLFIIQAIFGRWFIGGMLCIRLLIIIMSALILMTGHIRDYLLALVQWKMPYEIAYMVMVSLHFFPILKEEALDVYYSIQLRGTEMKKISFLRKLRVYLKICLPILAGAMSRAKDMAVSMEARAFRAKPKRTYMRKLTFKKRDWAVSLIFPVLAVIFIFTNLQIQNSDPALAAESLKEEPTQIILTWTKDAKTTQTISWKSSEKTAEYVRYATKKYYRSHEEYKESKQAKVTQVREGKYYRYSVTVTGLKRGTEYCYSVGAGKKWSERNSFETEASKSHGDKTFEFMALGDVQYNLRQRDYELWGKEIEKAFGTNPNIKFTLMLGDMVEKNADMDDWNAFFDEAENVFNTIPMMPTPGNHETSITPFTYLQMFDLPKNGPKGLEEEVYSFDYNNCHFVSLNSNIFLDERKAEMGSQKWGETIKNINSWLKKDLEENNRRWTIVTMHHPPYPVKEDSAIYGKIRKNWVPIMEREGVDLVLSGHQHMYMRTKEINGVIYVMTDSGQKPSHYYSEGEKLPSYVKKHSAVESTYEIFKSGEKNLEITTYDNSGKKIDSFKIKK